MEQIKEKRPFIHYVEVGFRKDGQDYRKVVSVLALNKPEARLKAVRTWLHSNINYVKAL